MPGKVPTGLDLFEAAFAQQHGDRFGLVVAVLEPQPAPVLEVVWRPRDDLTDGIQTVVSRDQRL